MFDRNLPVQFAFVNFRYHILRTLIKKKYYNTKKKYLQKTTEN